MNALSAAQTKEMLLAAAQAVIESKPLLTEIDSKIGDGDHGIGMETGMRKAGRPSGRCLSPPRSTPFSKPWAAP